MLKLIIKLFKIIFEEQVNAVTGLIKFCSYGGLFLIASFIDLFITILYSIVF